MPENAESKAGIASPVREGRRGQPGRPPARGTRTLGRCSFDGCLRLTWVPFQEGKSERAWKDSLRPTGDPNQPLHGGLFSV
jgi:hypothetical protein